MFIGSSTEGLEVARLLQAELEHDVDGTVWSQGVFGLSQSGLEALEAKARTFDFAALVLTPDDLVFTFAGTRGSVGLERQLRPPRLRNAPAASAQESRPSGGESGRRPKP
jgi:predicted nucleotide-binding protein